MSIMVILAYILQSYEQVRERFSFFFSAAYTEKKMITGYKYTEILWIISVVNAKSGEINNKPKYY